MALIGAAPLRPAEKQPVTDDRQTGGNNQSGHLFQAFDHRCVSAGTAASLAERDDGNHPPLWRD
ncbi:MAG: hypothetical protein VKM98_05890 [Cyanobacteriota bacterium]|nr:hypothetical protein [Cyanobacteriota bacterium]